MKSARKSPRSFSFGGAAARQSGLSASALSCFLAGTYEGDNQAVAGKLLAWKDRLSRKDSIPNPLTRSHGFVGTAASEAIRAGLDLAHLTADLVMVVGKPGYGKTVTLESYQRSVSGVWLVTMPKDCRRMVPMLHMLGTALGLSLSVTGGAAAMRQQIMARVRGTEGLIIIDEAQHLDTEALEELRYIHDMAKIGMVLCGDETLKVKVSTLSQINSRVGKVVMLKPPSRADIAAVINQYGVTGREAVDYLYAEAAGREGCLRCIVKTVRLAALSANGADETVGLNHLMAAWSDLALGGPI